MVSPMQLCSNSLFSVRISTNLPKPVTKSLTEDTELHLPRRRRATVLALVCARSMRATTPAVSSNPLYFAHHVVTLSFAAAICAGLLRAAVGGTDRGRIPSHCPSQWPVRPGCVRCTIECAYKSNFIIVQACPRTETYVDGHLYPQ